jgi:capsid portal protein
MINWSMELAKYVTPVKYVRNAHTLLLLEPEGDNLENLGIDVRIILKLIIKKWEGEGCRLD